ncbi:MAG: hypothetical protein JSR81_04655 [Proteobacteria bacterium]|nr:hypothetical protein [Pseudomonadota bacterium]
MADELERQGIVALGHVDRLLGILMERTEALREDTSELRQATRELTAASAEMRLAFQNAIDRLSAIEKAPTIPDLSARLKNVEEGVKDYRDMKRNIAWWLIRLALAALSLGALGGKLGDLLVSALLHRG